MGGDTSGCECGGGCSPSRGVLRALRAGRPLRVLDPRDVDYVPWSVRRRLAPQKSPWSHVFTGPIPAPVPVASTVVCGAHERESEVASRTVVQGLVVVGPLDELLLDGDEAQDTLAERGARVASRIPPLPYGRFGLNNVPFFEFESGPAGSKYGHYPTLIRDVHAVGAPVVRHPTQIQLLPEKLIPSGASPWMWPVAIPPARVAAAQVRLSQPIVDLEAAIRYCVAQKVELKFFLTFLTIGGGFVPSSAQYDAAGVQQYELGVATAWDTLHEGRFLRDDYGAFCQFDTSTERGWNLDTLDPNNGYKRYYYRELAKAVGQALEDLRADLATSGIALEDYIEAIEIGNEVDVRNVKWDSARGDHYPDSQGWGHVYYDCATALFDATATAGVSWLTLRLPGLASNADGTSLGGAYQLWESKRVFVDELLNNIRRECTAHGTHTLDQLVLGMDIHYYHRFGDATRNDIQRIGFIAADIWDLSVLFTGKYGLIPTLSMFESMVNVACTPATQYTPNGPTYNNGCEADLQWWNGWLPYPDYEVVFGDPVGDWRPMDSGADCPPKVDTAGSPFPSSEAALGAPALGPNDYQAIALWHRLAVGLAGASLAGLAAGGFIAGWHGLVLTNTGSFGLGGLRRDAHESSGSPRDANKALQRPAWFAMQRFIDVLGGATGVGVLSPVGVGGMRHVDLQRAIDTGGWVGESDVWVLEFENPGGWSAAELASGRDDVYPWAYLLFVDPHSAIARCADVTLSSGGVAFETLRVGTAPLLASTTPYFLPGPRGRPDVLGFAYVDWEPEAAVRGRSTATGLLSVPVNDHEYPTLIYARARVTAVTVVLR